MQASGAMGGMAAGWPAGLGNGVQAVWGLLPSVSDLLSFSPGAPKAPAAGRGDLLPPPPTPTTSLLDPSPRWPADLSFSL